MLDEQQWLQLIQLRPLLRNHIDSTHHIYRGRSWYVLTDNSNGRHLRYPEQAHFIISAMNGRDSLESILSHADNTLHNRDEIAQLFSELHHNGMLVSRLMIDASIQFERHQKNLKQTRWKKILSPLMLRFPLLDPDGWLKGSMPLIQPFFSKIFLWLWLFIISIGLYQCWLHWPELLEHSAARAFDPGNLILLWFCYPCVKGLHELGHAYATRKWGGEVHEMGIMLLVFIPVPYVDASASSRFQNKQHRMAVGAAGIMIELLLAALSILIWVNVQPGLIRDLAFNIALIGGVSTVVFNGNPLLRFDGYYVLADAIEIPNLSSRSKKYLRYLVQHYIFGLEQSTSPVTARGERLWFFSYGLAAGFYQIFMGLSIAIYIAGKFFLLGVILAAMVLFTRLILPLIKFGRYLAFHPGLSGSRWRAIASVMLFVFSLWILIGVVPVPEATQAEGVIELPEQANLRVNETGFVVQVLQPPGQRVSAGMPLIQLSNPWLKSRLKEQKALVEEMKARYAMERAQSPGRARAIASQLAAEEEQYAQIEQRVQSLLLKSPLDGIFNLSHAQDVSDLLVARGDVIAYVAPSEAKTVRVAILQSDTEKVRHNTLSVELLQPGKSHNVYKGNILREVPQVDSHLPDRRLGAMGGGDIAVDSREKSGLIAMEPVYQFDIALKDTSLPGYFGDRVYVRFVHPSEPVFNRWYRSVRQLLLARWNV